MTDIRKETDSLGEVDVAADKLWRAQTQRSLEHFSIGKDLMPREMITAYAEETGGQCQLCRRTSRRPASQVDRSSLDEILAGQHQDMFPLHVWMTGSGTQAQALTMIVVRIAIEEHCCLRDLGFHMSIPQVAISRERKFQNER